MKKIDPQYINTNAAQPFKKGTWVHLQEAYQEAIAALANYSVDFAYDPAKIYFLWGCANTGSGSSYIISAGALFFNSEIYLVDAVSFTASIGEVAVGRVTETFYTALSADPVTFTDGTAHNVHSIRKMVFSADTSGSGDADYAAGVFNNQKVTAPLNSGWTSITGAGQDSVFYRKDYKNNTLSFGGTALGPVTGNVFTLPLGFRPLHKKEMFCYLIGQSPGNYRIGLLIIGTDGVVSYGTNETFGTPSVTVINFDGITINLD